MIDTTSSARRHGPWALIAGVAGTHDAHAPDEDISNVCFAGTRVEAIALKRAYCKTPRVRAT